MAGKTIALVSPVRSSFVETDYRLLSGEYHVEQVTWRGRGSYRDLKKTLRGSAAVLSWFAGDHAAVAGFLARRWGKPSILVAGGGDVACMPEIGYGAMAGSLKSRLAARWSLRLSDAVLAFSHFSKDEITRIHEPRRIEILPLGVDVRRFSPAGTKEAIVLTVGHVSASNVLRKGHGVFLEAARLLRDTKFVLVGESVEGAAEALRRRAPANVNFVGRLSDDDLLALYRRAKVYVQASAHEGFSLAVAEAMAVECVPVVTRRGALPEVVGETGRYVPFMEPRATAEAIQDVLGLQGNAGVPARQRVVERFTLERRRDGLLGIVGSVLSEGAR